MRRFIAGLTFLVLLVAMFAWTAPRRLGAPATGMPFNLALADQAQLDTSTANAQQTATADILLAHDRATSSAATSTQNAAQTQVVLQQTRVVFQQTEALLQQTQAQFSLQLTSDSATENAGATATQRQREDNAASTTTAIAGVIATQTQAVIATQQRQADQARQSAAQEQEAIAFLWMWGPPLFLLAVVVVAGWAFWYWEIHKRVRRRSSNPLVAPLFAQPAPALAGLPLPEAEVDIDPVTEPDDQVSGWLEEVKEKLLAREKEDHVDLNV